MAPSGFAAEPSPGIGFVALATLRHLDRHRARTVTELAHADQVTTQAISLRIRPLVDAGLVTRSPDPVDARRSVVTATERGRAAVATRGVARSGGTASGRRAVVGCRRTRALRSPPTTPPGRGEPERGVLMTTDRTSEIQAFFADFERASADEAWDRYGDMFLATFMNMDPAVARPLARDDLVAFLPHRKAVFERVGATGTRLASLDVDISTTRTSWLERRGTSSSRATTPRCSWRRPSCCGTRTVRGSPSTSITARWSICWVGRLDRGRSLVGGPKGQACRCPVAG